MKRDYIIIMPNPDGLTAAKTSNTITNGIRMVHWVIARHGKNCGSGFVMG